tara:strand:+ start:10147 stop:10791 length:645 start_codon:yes stop_codon:yes gene_type:complete
LTGIIIIDMRNRLNYYWAKILKKIRGKAILDSTIRRTSKVESGCNLIDVFMDKHTFCGYDCEIMNCEIGSYVSIASGVVIGGGMHPLDWVAMSPVFYEGRDSVKKKFSEFKREESKRVIIGHDVWIGQNALIKQGISIGTGSVIGMGSVVTKDVLPYSIVAGNPARLIRMRFDSETINSLIKSEWWNLEENLLVKVAENIKDPAAFLESIKIYK